MDYYLSLGLLFGDILSISTIMENGVRSIGFGLLHGIVINVVKYININAVSRFKEAAQLYAAFYLL